MESAGGGGGLARFGAVGYEVGGAGAPEDDGCNGLGCGGMVDPGYGGIVDPG